MSVGTARENCSEAERQFGNAQTEGSFGAGMVNVQRWTVALPGWDPLTTVMRLLSGCPTVNEGGNAVIRPLHVCRGRFLLHGSLVHCNKNAPLAMRPKDAHIFYDVMNESFKGGEIICYD